MKTPAVKATLGLSLLGAYEDSEDEDAAENTPTATKAKHNQSADIDSTLANFMAEIDAITTQPAQTAESEPEPSAPAPTPPRPEPKTDQQTQEFQYNTQYSLAGGEVSSRLVWFPTFLHYTGSSSVNGNGVAHHSSLTEQSVAAAPAPASKRETKKKEVIESVVALTSEEEERRGVAATLLAPLIPEEVKEAEEKWRKKVLAIEETVEAPQEVEGEATPSLDSPAPRDTDSQSNQRSRNHSAESSDREEEAEEDTMELELALERKKAELRALEEGDGSAGGSSPCSEASQEGPRNLLLKKNKWKTAFLRAPSPDSSSRGSDKGGWVTPEHSDNAQTAESEPEPSAPAQTPPRPEPKTDQQTQEFQYNTQYSLAGASTQLGSSVTNMKTRELSMDEKQAIVKLREDGKSIRAIAKTLAIASTTIWNVLKKKETTGVLINRPRMGRPRKTSAVDDRNIVKAVKKDPKTTVSDISNNLERAGVKVSQSTVRRRLHEQKYRGYTKRCKPLISKNNKKASLEFAKNYRDKPQTFWSKVL